MFERWRRRHAESGASDDATVHLQAHCAAALACGNTTVYRNPNLNRAAPSVDEGCPVVSARIDGEGQTHNISAGGNEAAVCTLTDEALLGDPRPYLDFVENIESTNR